jgi:hypothetical protein
MMQRITRFPSRLYHFIWRNWDLLAARRLASLLGLSVSEVRRLAHDLGLAAQPSDLERHRSRFRSLVIRRNWFLLPLEQIQSLLGMTASELGKFMREDDFLDHKVPPKPVCARLEYRAPSAAQRRAAHRLRDRLRAIREPETAQDSFSFLASLNHGRAEVSPPPVSPSASWALAPRIMHPFDTPHNPTAFDPGHTTPPHLRLLREFGADALWFPIVLFDVVQLSGYPEFGAKREDLLPKIRALIRRAGRAGLGIYLYLCEPRAQPAAFFRRHPQLRGARVHQAKDEEMYFICASAPAGKALVRDAIRELCRGLPGLRGLIVISASEYPTHCWSHGRGGECPRCGERRPADVVAEVLALMQEGIDASGRAPGLVAWNWGWQWMLKRREECDGDVTRLDLAADARAYVFRKLPAKVTPLLNLEYGTRVRRGGVENRVWEYSISQPRQGPFAAVQRRALDRLGRRPLARIHISNSTEFLGAPYIPALQLVAEKMMSVRDNGYAGFMGSWIFGGYPSPNLLVARELSRAARPRPERALRRVAGLYYGPRNAQTVIEAWRHFSQAFRRYPFSIPLQYCSPLHIAPAAEWSLQPTGHRSLMFWPSDDPENYCDPYGPETVAQVFGEIAAGWEKGLACLRCALDNADARHRAAAQRDYGVAECFWLCCRSFVNHLRLCASRESRLRSRRGRAELRALVTDELVLAQRYYQLLRSDSRLGFEASMQYFILPNDVREKILGLEQMLDTLRRLDGPAA